MTYPKFKIVQSENLSEIEEEMNKLSKQRFIPHGDLIITFKPTRHVSCNGYESGFVGERVEGCILYTQVMIQ